MTDFVSSQAAYDTLLAQLHAMYPAADVLFEGRLSTFGDGSRYRYALLTHHDEGYSFPDNWGHDGCPVLNFLPNELLTKSNRKRRVSDTEPTAIGSTIHLAAQEMSASVITTSGNLMPASTSNSSDLFAGYASTLWNSPACAANRTATPARYLDLHVHSDEAPVPGYQTKPRRTFLRYPGGKSRALDKIRPYFPATFDEYREPFIGGGSVLFSVRREFPSVKCWINDINPAVYAFYKMARDQNPELIDALLSIKKWSAGEVGRRFFDDLPNLTQGADELKTAVAFYYRNKCSFSGLTGQGSFAPNPWGHNFTERCIKSLREMEELLSGVKITNLHYADLLGDTDRNIFTFFDPPYDLKDMFLYGNGGANHRGFDHAKFCDDVAACRHRWLITYNDNDLLRRMYARYHVDVVSLQYTMRATVENGADGNLHAKRGAELFIRNYR